LKLLVFLARLISGLHAKITKIVSVNFVGGDGDNFFNPLQLPQFWLQGAENFSALRHIGTPHSFWISRSYPS